MNCIILLKTTFEYPHLTNVIKLYKLEHSIFSDLSTSEKYKIKLDTMSCTTNPQIRRIFAQKRVIFSTIRVPPYQSPVIHPTALPSSSSFSIKWFFANTTLSFMQSTTAYVIKILSISFGTEFRNGHRII